MNGRGTRARSVGETVDDQRRKKSKDESRRSKDEIGAMPRRNQSRQSRKQDRTEPRAETKRVSNETQNESVSNDGLKLELVSRSL